MAHRTTRLERQIQRAVVRTRRRMFRRLAGTERQLEAEHARIARRLRTRLAGRTPRQIEREVQRELTRRIDQRIASVGRGTAQAAEVGVSAQERTLNTVFGGGNQDELLAVESRRATGVAIRQELNRGIGASLEEGVRLSARFHLNAQETSQVAGRVLGASVEAGESVATAARQLAQVTSPVVELPRYITDIRAAVRGTDASALRRAISLHTNSIDGLVDTELRAAARAFVRTAQTSTAADLERQLNHFVRDRALAAERRIAQTEMQRAFNQGYVRAAQGQPWAVGMKWNLAGEHPQPDICDLFASQDSGFGEGGYRTGGAPDLPAHPGCLCYLTTIVDKDFQRRRLARSRRQPEPPRPWESGRRQSGLQWLRSQPPNRVRRILGEGRFHEFRQGRNPFAQGRSATTGPAMQGFRPLYKMQGKRAPVRRRGPRMGISAADRAKLLRPSQRRELLRRMSRPRRP